MLLACKLAVCAALLQTIGQICNPVTVCVRRGRHMGDNATVSLSDRRLGSELLYAEVDAELWKALSTSLVISAVPAICHSQCSRSVQHQTERLVAEGRSNSDAGDQRDSYSCLFPDSPTSITP